MENLKKLVVKPGTESSESIPELIARELGFDDFAIEDFNIYGKRVGPHGEELICGRVNYNEDSGDVEFLWSEAGSLDPVLMSLFSHCPERILQPPPDEDDRLASFRERVMHEHQQAETKGPWMLYRPEGYDLFADQKVRHYLFAPDARMGDVFDSSGDKFMLPPALYRATAKRFVPPVYKPSMEGAVRYRLSASTRLNLIHFTRRKKETAILVDASVPENTPPDRKVMAVSFDKDHIGSLIKLANEHNLKYGFEPANRERFNIIRLDYTKLNDLEESLKQDHAPSPSPR